MAAFELVIRPREGWQPVDLREIWTYRDLLRFLVWRDIKIRYKQTLLGGLWAVLQPLIAMLIFGLLFNRIAGIRNVGAPYPLFTFAGLVPWTFFANAIGLASNSLVGSEQMIRKIYFPRVMLPMAMIAALALDMLISLVMMAGLMLYYRWPTTTALLWLPVFLFGSCLASSGLGLFLSALNVQYRDVKYAVPFFTQMMFFVTPVLYPVSLVPANFQFILVLNPIAGMVEGFRHALLGSPVSWTLVTASFTESLLLFLAGLFFFRRLERTFADVI